MPPNRRHVVPKSDGTWNVKKPGAQRASGNFPTQKQAEDRARQILKNSGGGELTTHDRNNRIRDSDTVSPGNDPNPPTDKK